ncbi:MAG: tRNA (adenosine(37)-N6)-dimethylallyltransferase MiaA, partial [Chitinophagaceae bacterium]
FEQFAMEKVIDLFRDNDLVIMVGGTGLYLKAFLDGIDPIPAVPPPITEELIEAYDRFGLPWLQQQIAAVDPLFYHKAEVRNPHRLLRALGVFRATGTSIDTFRQQAPKPRPFQTICILLELPLPGMHHNISNRVNGMMQQGLEAEVRALIPAQQLQPLHTVGYKELFDFFEGHANLPQAIEAIKLHTRQYAKRQLTWFRKDLRYTRFSPNDREGILYHIDRHRLAPAQT